MAPRFVPPREGDVAQSHHKRPPRHAHVVRQRRLVAVEQQRRDEGPGALLVYVPLHKSETLLYKPRVQRQTGHNETTLVAHWKKTMMTQKQVSAQQDITEE